ncbi:MAG: SMP-30/gluconolactonase/LRE family protein [Gemmatimonadetes bacterium]|nr:SMP-30/gluconolactonase/LRE family protein [Gemmatimonadota bacterium]
MSFRFRVHGAGIVALAALLGSGCGGEGGQVPVDMGIRIADVGFMTPESVLMDTVADVYLVSNINGQPTAEDDNGFISRLTPDGQVENLKWIDGAASLATLDAPKGMAIKGDTLFVTDIKCIRMFNRTSGESFGSLCVEGTTFLNDIAVGPEGSLFVTDSGLNPDFSSSGTDAVYRLSLEEGRPHVTIAKDAALGAPNGIAIGSRGIFVVTYGSGEVLRFTPQGEKTVVMPASNRQLDGIVFSNDGGFLFSAWGDSSVYHVDGAGQIHRLITGVASPADIGYDPRRNRVLVPLFTQNAVLLYDLR